MKNNVVFGLVVFGLVFIFIDLANSVEWKPANQVTLAWGPVTKTEAGDPIPPEDSILYEVFIIPENGNKSIDGISQGETGDLQKVVSFSVEGRFFLGVRAYRVKDGVKVASSLIAWTDNPEVVKDGITQGVVFFFGPGSPKTLEIKNYAN